MKTKMELIIAAVLTVTMFLLSALLTEFAFYFAVTGVIFTVAMTVIGIVEVTKLRRHLERFAKAVDSMPDSAFLSVNYIHNRVTASNSFAALTGLKENPDSMTAESVSAFVRELKSSPLKDEPNIYMSPVKNIWLKVKTISTPENDICVVSDVSEYVESLNTIKSLRFYDIETGVLSKDAFISKLSSVANENESTVGAVLFVVKGLDKVTSFTGAHESSKIIVKIAEFLKKYENPHNLFAGRISYNEFGLIMTDTYNERVKKFAAKLTEGLTELLNGMKENSGKYVKIFCGYYSFGTEERDINSVISAVDFAAYDAGQKNSETPVEYSNSDFEKSSQEFAKLRAFDEVLNTNAIDYHFQPIVSASSGKIIGYEALMRPRKTNGYRFNPVEMLKLGVKHDRTYEIERVTLFNTMKVVRQNAEFFKGRKLFINIITTNLLTEADYNELLREYGDVFESVVLEITENGYTSEEAAALLIKRYQNFRVQLALDDYGTGYANGEMLLALKPQYLKIDRKLVMNIDKDEKKRRLVFSTIDFARTQSILTIAEGVEREEELDVLCEMGIDYVQGFYSARPSPVLIKDLPSDIRQKIISSHLAHNHDGKLLEIFDESDSDSESENPENTFINPDHIYNLEELALDGITQVTVNIPEITFTGGAETSPCISIIVPQGVKTKITLDNACMTATDGAGVILLPNAAAELIIVGKCVIDAGGIRVPENTTLKISGDGTLEVRETENNGIAIGGSVSQDCGTIIISNKAMTVQCNGDNTVAIGAGGQSAETDITVINTDLKIFVAGNRCLGLGTLGGRSKIKLDKCKLSGLVNGRENVAVGTLTGYTHIESSADVSVHCSGGETAVFGGISGSESDIIISEGKYDLKINCSEGMAIGCNNGRSDISIKSGEITIYGEGGHVGGIGGFSSAGEIYIQNGYIDIFIRAADRNPIGLSKGKAIVAGGNIKLDEVDSPELFAPVDVLLEPHVIELTPNEDFFNMVTLGDKSYSYRARADKDGKLIAYLPIGYNV
ncbi:MAG: EAL domain-containing protein [Ruminococcus sp.]|jgi:EAL domain-containing protein (putative c-di-GMP-specific phosphodiesterase class I)/GGDEF domain-containing protein|nr:EAL domain-containing protein [Ruminococcus sp.]